MYTFLNNIKILHISIITFIFISLVISAQEYDEAFIESLPENIREQVLSEMQKKSKENTKNFSRPTSTITKDVKSQKSNRFGVNIFNSMQTSFMPINEPNFDGSYVLDFGDVLEIQLIGSKSSIQELEIVGDGSINLLDVGKIYLAGLTLSKADDLIKTKIGELYTGTKVFISLINTRDMQIYILGEALNPGLYTLNGNSNVLSALYMAGGISEKGSFRNIKLKRSSKVILTIDLYDFLINGNVKNITGLRSGDVIFVEPIGKIATTYGGLKRPMQYELLDDETYMDLINYSNGFTPLSQTSSMRITNSADNIITLIKSYEDIKNKIPLDYDTIFVPTQKFKTVNISGAVNFPGIYELPLNATLSSIIIRAGGYTDNAYPFGGVLTNELAKSLSDTANKMFKQKFVESLINYGVEINEGTNALLNQVDSEINARVIAEFNMDLLKTNKDLDVILNDKDKIFIPTQTSQVFVYGAVNSPGATSYIPNKQVSEYILSKGGITNLGDKNQIFIVNPNGESVLTSQARLRIFNDSIDNLIYPGSMIFISPKMNLSTTQSAAIWAPLLSSLALSLASLQVINGN